MEKKISMISSGKVHFEDVLRDEVNLFRNKFMEFTDKIEKMDQLFEVTFSPLDSSGKPFSKCGKCRRYMHYIPLRYALIRLKIGLRGYIAEPVMKRTLYLLKEILSFSRSWFVPLIVSNWFCIHKDQKEKDFQFVRYVTHILLLKICQHPWVAISALKVIVLNQ